VQADSVDDLWHLSHVIEPGDLCRAVTQRRREAQEDRVRADKTEKVTLVLPVRAESVAFDESVVRLRILGRIDGGPDDISGHHTLTLEPHQWVEIEKPDGWHRAQVQRLDEAVAAGREPRVIVVALDDDEATVAVLQPYGIREVATIASHRSGKDFAGKDTRESFFQDILLALRETAPQECPLLVVGPGFTREHLAKWLKGKEGAPAAVATEPTGQSGRVGVQEAIKRGAITRIDKRVRVARETEAVDTFMTRVAREEPATYGPAEVRRALEQGAVELLLVTDGLVRLAEGRALLDLAHRTRAEALVVGTGHDAGVLLERFGGVAALLRYRLS